MEPAPYRKLGLKKWSCLVMVATITKNFLFWLENNFCKSESRPSCNIEIIQLPAKLTNQRAGFRQKTDSENTARCCNGSNGTRIFSKSSVTTHTNSVEQFSKWKTYFSFHKLIIRYIEQQKFMKTLRNVEIGKMQTKQADDPNAMLVENLATHLENTWRCKINRWQPLKTVHMNRR